MPGIIPDRPPTRDTGVHARVHPDGRGLRRPRPGLRLRGARRRGLRAVHRLHHHRPPHHRVQRPRGQPPAPGDLLDAQRQRRRPVRLRGRLGHRQDRGAGDDARHPPAGRGGRLDRP
ncbi:hypothetical protein SBRY_30316 [Actinacidiphila bryophytorum]|uniref:Uncharacterized protein n=1 Tax=Actinacidiphila bryophytorum TaxID=1436133 RepID=A0A9W4M9A4_9ACTN|nr:hypothetical protein SBRY_30316 [Actinacidiphila bryophytorum]